jgi:hypothetical protein
MLLLAVFVLAAVFFYQCTYQARGVIPPGAISDNDFIISNMIRIDKTGDVFINWERTEAYANHCPDYTTQTCAITRLLMSVREDSWKPYQ